MITPRQAPRPAIQPRPAERHGPDQRLRCPHIQALPPDIGRTGAEETEGCGTAPFDDGPAADGARAPQRSRDAGGTASELG